MKPRLLLIDNDPVQSKVKKFSLSKMFDVLLVSRQSDIAKDNIALYPVQIIVIDLLPIRERIIDLPLLKKQLSGMRLLPPVFVISHIDSVEEYIAHIQLFPLMDVIVKPVSNAFIENRVHALVTEQKPLRFSLNLFSLDDATAMANKQQFMHHLSRMWVECIKVNEPISMLYINIDYFALMQSHSGKDHAYHCLRMLLVMAQSLIFRKDDLVVRARRDDFYVLLPACDERGVQSKIKSLQNMLNQALLPNDVSPLSPFVSVSIGHVSQRPQTIDEINIFLDLVKARLNKAKEDRDNMLFDHASSSNQ
jgi:diguanylate cyclase (GGDEF)-like protein